MAFVILITGLFKSQEKLKAEQESQKMEFVLQKESQVTKNFHSSPLPHIDPLKKIRKQNGKQLRPVGSKNSKILYDR